MIHDRIPPHDVEPPTRIGIEDAFPELATPFSVQVEEEEELMENETPPAETSSPRPETPQPEQKMTTKRKLNVRLLRKIQRHILEEPRRFFMDGYFAKAKTDEGWKNATVFFSDVSSVRPPCGTAACIAGTANLLTGGKKLNAFKRAATLIGVNPYCNGLFITSDWPEQFNVRYSKAKTPKQRAKIACARIEHLIKTGE